MATYSRWVIERIASLALVTRRLLATRWVRILSYVLVCVVVLWWIIVVGSHIPEISEQLRFLDPRYLSISYAFLLASAGIAGTRWPLIICASEHAYRFGWLYRVWFLSQVTRHIPGGIWNYASGIALTSSKIRARTIAGAYVVDALLRVAGNAIITVFLLIAINGFRPYWLLGISLLYLGFLCWLYPIVSRSHFQDSVAARVRGTAGGGEPVAVLPSSSRLALPLVVSVVSSLFSGIAFFFFVRSFPQTHEMTPDAAILGLVVADTAGFLAPFAPEGLGVREGVLAYWLTKSVSNLTALTISGFSRIWLLSGEALWITVLLGGSWLAKKAAVRSHAPLGNDVPDVD